MVNGYFPVGYLVWLALIEWPQFQVEQFITCRCGDGKHFSPWLLQLWRAVTSLTMIIFTVLLKLHCNNLDPAACLLDGNHCSGTQFGVILGLRCELHNNKQFWLNDELEKLAHLTANLRAWFESWLLSHPVHSSSSFLVGR